MKRKRVFYLGVAALIVIAVVTTLRLFVLKDKNIYKEVTSYSDGNNGYSCSRPIKAKLQSIPGPLPGKYEDYIPVNRDEANLLCHSTVKIENKGKITVLQKTEVQSLIRQYSYKDVSIKALEFKYIKDPGFVDRLLPAYKGKEIGCIIILDTPGQDKVYLENDALESFEELDYRTFRQYLEQASPADRTVFYENLK